MCKKHKLRINHDLQSKVRGTGKDSDRERMMKNIYPDWSRLDAGKLKFFATDKKEWIKLVIENVDYPGVCILKIDTLIDALIDYKTKMAEREKRARQDANYHPEDGKDA